MQIGKHFFIAAVFTGMVAGGIFGAITGQEYVLISTLAALFLKSLKMMVIPIVAASIITGISSLGDIRKLKKIGLLTITYYISTTLLAVTIGLILVNFIEPGTMAATETDGEIFKKSYSIFSVILAMVPENIFKAMADGDVLPVIIFSIIFGAALTTIGEKGEAILDIFNGIFHVSIKIIEVIILFAPIGVFALVAERIGRAGGWDAFSAELGSLGLYIVTVLAGLFLHAFVILPIILVVLGRIKPFLFVKQMVEALTMAFSTASSSATLPVTLKCLNNTPEIKKSVSSFVLPLGATVNMDGTALYEAVAAIFIAQAYGIELSFSQQAIVAITATLAAIGAAGIPEAGLVTMIIVLESVGLPAEGIGLILAVDWFLDRCRTTVNVWGDGVGAAVLSNFTNHTKLGAGSKFDH